ncbi:MAG: hypothetical protein QNK30_01900 [Bacteroidales bacterium]|nr:hypothetical protein [Bacteroidales bacterium]
MKTLLIKLSLAFMVIAFISCDKDSQEPEKKELDDKEIIENISDPADTTAQDTTTISETYCGTVHTFELRYYSTTLYGTLEMYNNEDSLYIVYKVDDELANNDWGIHSTYLFLGDYNNLPKLENGSVDWYNEAITMELYDGNEPVVIKSYALGELADCFGFATKVKLNNPDPDGANVSPRAFINVDGTLEYPWMQNYEYCIQSCSSD